MRRFIKTMVETLILSVIIWGFFFGMFAYWIAFGY